MRHAMFATMVLVVAVGGCETGEKADGDGAVEAKAVVPPATRQGYALLYDLVSRQKDVTKILIIKSVTAPTKTIVTRIAQTAGAMSDALEQWAEADGIGLDREKASGLPAFEMGTRDAIQASASRYLLFGGDDFEVKLIYTQMNACEYGAAMAKQLAEQDGVSEERRRALVAFAKAYDEVFAALAARLKAATD